MHVVINVSSPRSYEAHSATSPDLRLLRGDDAANVGAQNDRLANRGEELLQAGKLGRQGTSTGLRAVTTAAYNEVPRLPPLQCTAGGIDWPHGLDQEPAAVLSCCPACLYVSCALRIDLRKVAPISFGQNCSECGPKFRVLVMALGALASYIYTARSKIDR